jgi:hypothetical protein
MAGRFQFRLRTLLGAATLASVVTAFLVMGYGQAAFGIVCGLTGITVGKQSGSLGCGVAASLAAPCLFCGVGFIVALLLGTPGP